jgi:hypothetical protein
MNLFRSFIIALVCLASPTLAQEELFASKTTPQYASLRTLTNGLSAVSLMWPLNSLAENRIEAAHAGLATIISGATETMTAFEAETFREINGINIGVTLLPQHIMLTMTAPEDGFKQSISHLGELLTSPNFSRDWYARQSVQQQPLLATKTRRPDNVMGVLADFILFPEEDDGTDTSNATYRFGMPSHVVLRTEADIQNDLTKILRSLPLQKEDVNFPKAVVTNLPKGVIFAPDPDSRETLMFIVKSETFEDSDDFVGANLLIDYMGAYQGSEMFRIIRQELRAAYNPASTFEQLGKNRAMMALSATVLSDEWPVILREIEDIYNRARSGEVTDQGMNNNKRRMLGTLDYRFNINPRWGASQYMDEYVGGTAGQISFPLFRAMVDADIAKTRSNAADHLPPFDDYLIILIGGTNPPPKELRDKGYCLQKLSEPLRYCLTQMR